MMELSHSLLLNEEALKQLPETKRPVFIFEWLRFLDKVLVTSKKVSFSSSFISTGSFDFCYLLNYGTFFEYMIYLT